MRWELPLATRVQCPGAWKRHGGGATVAVDGFLYIDFGDGPCASQ